MESIMAIEILRGKIEMIMLCRRDGEDEKGVGFPRPQKSNSLR
jgi:hypothetical protein